MKEKDLFGKVSQLLMRYGIKSMTMDEVARQLGISKKTLYQFVENKKDLVKKMMKFHVEGEQCEMQEKFVCRENAIEQIMFISKEVSEQMKNMHPSIIFDLKKYHPEAFQILEDHKQNFIKKCIKNNLEQGIEQGYYRDNLQVEIVTTFYLAMVSSIMNDEFSSTKYNFSKIHAEMMRYHIGGIASHKGREYLQTKFKQ